MKIVYNKLLPFKGYKAMTLWPFMLVRKDMVMTEADLNHEQIHGEQQKELLVVLFYLWYVVEYVVKLIVTWSHKKAYRSISFEQEAYRFENDLDYRRRRRRYYWMRFVFTVE